MTAKKSVKKVVVGYQPLEMTVSIAPAPQLGCCLGYVPVDLVGKFVRASIISAIPLRLHRNSAELHRLRERMRQKLKKLEESKYYIRTVQCQVSKSEDGKDGMITVPEEWEGFRVNVEYNGVNLPRIE